MNNNRIMGNLKYFGLILVAGMFAACSDNLESSGNVNDGPKTGEGYVKVAINLPTVSGSRANESFDDGDENEWSVKSGIIAFFEGAKGNENEAKFVKAYDLANIVNNAYSDDDPNHVTNKIEAQIIEAPQLSNDNNQMYALVILNRGNEVSVHSQGKQLIFNNDDVETNGHITIDEKNTFNDLINQQWIIDAATIADPTTNGFLMINSPLYKEVESNYTTQTLVPVTVYESKDAAEGNTADRIFVERVVAKVDVKLGENVIDGVYTIKEGAYKGSEVIFNDKTDEKLGWVLNVTNKNTKPVRDVSDYSIWSKYTIKEHIFGSSKIDGSDWSRIYWAKDNNYGKNYLNTEGNEPDMDKVNADFNVYSMDDETAAEGSEIKWGAYSTTGASAKVNAQYCLENTDLAVSADGQNYNEYNVTSILVKAKFDIKKSDGQEGDYSFFTIGDIAKTYSIDEFYNYVAEKCSVTVNLSESKNELAKANAGYYEGVDELKSLIVLEDGQKYENLVHLDKVAYYKDGDCYYYAAPIQHFALTKEEPISNENYLGKYGVVRNNWYNITITKATAPGIPEITDPEEPVEKEEGYIKCEINVLSWAKRTQDVEL